MHLTALAELFSKTKALGFSAPDHFVFPGHGRDKKIDPTRPMTSWRSAWRSLRKASGLENVRFHDGRHTALTRLAEASQPDWVIQAQMGHVSAAMMKSYSHVRRQAPDQAAMTLKPTFSFVPKDPGLEEPSEEPAETVTVTVHVTVGRSGRRDA
jgi:integrase